MSNVNKMVTINHSRLLKKYQSELKKQKMDNCVVLKPEGKIIYIFNRLIPRKSLSSSDVP
jgi:hypothetical protein